MVYYRIVEESWLEPKHIVGLLQNSREGLVKHIVGLLYRIVEKGWVEPKHIVGLLQNSRGGLVRT